MSDIVKIKFYTNYLGNIYIICKNDKIYEVGIGELKINESDDSKNFSKRCQKFLEKLNNYFNGKPINIKLEDLYLDRVPSLFYRDVYRETLKIPYGSVSTYAKIARNIGKPRAYRSVATALRKNPFPIFVPCHRVIRSDGTIGGRDQDSFSFRKKLLNIERRKSWEN